MKRPIFSLISALVLTAGLLLTTAAAAGIQLVTSGTAAASQAVTLTGLSPACQSLQLTLSLSGGDTTYTYQPDSGLNRNGIYATSKQSGSQVTLYLTAKNGVLAEEGTLTLGTLTSADGSVFTVTGFSGLLMVDASSDQLPGNEDSGGNGSTGDDSTGGGSAGGGSAGGGSAGGGSAGGGSAGGGTEENPDQDESPRPHPFTDVADGAWYADAVQAVYELALMTGTTPDRFSPDLTTSRAMLVTMLYRLEGSPAASGAAPFPDVADGQWYAGAVAWASASGIVTGYDNGRFGPEDTITREQLATIFYRYASWKGYTGASPAPMDSYRDADQVSPYAVDAMGWAISAGLITGTSDTTLSPSDFATRAQAAVILSRFCKNLESK